MKLKDLMKYKKTLFTILFAVILFFLGKNLYTGIKEIEDFSFSSINWLYMSAASLYFIFTLIFPVYAWMFLIKSLGSRIKFLPAMKVWFLSNAGRYIPGKIWQAAGMIGLGSREGVEKGALVQSVIYSQFMANFIGMCFVFTAVRDVFLPRDNFLRGPHMYVIFGILLFVLFTPGVLKGIINIILGYLKKEPLETDIKTSNLMIYAFLQLINWLNIGVSFYLFTIAFKEFSLLEAPFYIFILPVAWTIGLLALFAPGGIGVRELVLTGLMTPVTGAPLAALIPILHRVWVTLFEAGFALWAYFYYIKRKK